MPSDSCAASLSANADHRRCQRRWRYTRIRLNLIATSRRSGGSASRSVRRRQVRCQRDSAKP